ncbi:Bifunctional purine biosynthetic protein ADE1-like protein 2 [Colletotrichum chlorophyti]|uniref:Bifunctional purine biosynthetic protein ADE1-like protein 2 n=1 Tax=Colletotrichum chlorophyti TaxID=708187 RepID=A0A1Q8RQX2_9PEZI|nr:Bifunctional purine biosynthetic protein ADE1-like protein 2 [Colletotrichum chlorophyti]
MDQGSSYQYQPLPPIAPEGRTPPFTRLLFVQPGSGEDPFEAYLQIVDIENAPPYEALSYTWGKPTDEPRDYIWLQGYPLPIKPNLEDALRSLRLPAQVRRLWIDALCIDQSNVDERSRQVQYMRLVYKHAARVIVWLGLKTAGTHEAFQAAESLARIREYTNPVAGANAGPLDPEAVQALVSSMVDGLPETCMAHLEEVFERQYFSRCWCVQEVVASSWAIAKIEELEMSFFDLIASLIVLAQWKGEILIDRPFELWNLILMRRQPNKFMGEPEVEGSIGSFLSLLELTRTLQATDDRDKVFSLLGICDEGLNPVLALTQVMGNNNSWHLRLMRRGFTRLVLTQRQGGFNPVFDDRTHKSHSELDKEVGGLAEAFLTQMAEYGLPQTEGEYGHAEREDQLQTFGAGARYYSNSRRAFRFLLIGEGVREHSLAWKLTQSQSVGHVYVVPGNAGTEPYPKHPTAETQLQVVVKADGLVAGKGVIPQETLENAEKALEGTMLDGETVVIEEFEDQSPRSIFALPEGQEHKRALDGDKGLNTGGVGVYAPVSRITPEQILWMEETIVRRLLSCLEASGNFINKKYRACRVKMVQAAILAECFSRESWYLRPSEPKVLEYDVRFGHPEIQSMILLHAAEGLAKIILPRVEGRLGDVTLNVFSKFACNITVAAGGYPVMY